MMNMINTKKFLVVVCGLFSITSLQAQGEATSVVEKQSTADAQKTQLVDTQKPSAASYPLDTIRAVIYTEEATVVITQSDVDRLGLDGTARTLDELILAHLMYQDAVKFKMTPDEDTIDKHLKAMQRTHDLTLDQIKEMFGAAGYTYEEGRQELAMLNTINTVLDYKVRSRLLVPEKDIIAYYEANPIMEPASYQVERAAVWRSPTESKQDFQKRIQESQCDFEWSEPFWIMEADLAADKKFITTLQIGELSEPQEIKGGFELFRLKEARPEHLVPLADRSLEISNALRKPRYQQLMKEYEEQLMENASIVRF